MDSMDGKIVNDILFLCDIFFSFFFSRNKNWKKNDVLAYSLKFQWNNSESNLRLYKNN